MSVHNETPIFEALNWIFVTTMGNNLLVWYLAQEAS